MAPAGFSFASGNLRKLLDAPRYLLGALRARSAVRDPSVWVIGSAFGVADGALAFARAARELSEPPTLVWLARSPAEADDARAAGFDEVLDRDSREGLEATLRAGLVAITHGFGDVNRYGVTGAVIVQLWHGAPLKKLHADSPAVVGAGALGRIPGMATLTRWAYRRGSSRISLLPVSSPMFQPFLRSAFHLCDEVRVLGEPRTDVLFSGEPADLTAAARDLLSRLVGDLGGSRVVLFAPTWRDGEVDPSIPTGQEWQQIEEFCERRDLVLVVRPHPLGVGAYRRDSARVRLLPPSLQPESMPLLWGASVLVTDYSSILVDYAVTGRPIVLLAPDLDRYRSSRGLYVDYSEIADGGWTTSWPDALAALDAVLTDPDRLAAAGRHSRDLAARFHTFTDGRSAQRVVAAAADLVDQRFGVASRVG